MNAFQGYEKMPDSFKKLASDEKLSRKFNKMKWVVTEKVHGANFSFVYENGNVHYAKRKEYLSWEDDFFGFQLMVRENESKVIRVFAQLQNSMRFQRATIYGELFGGEYPHDEVAQDTRVQAIQTGVYYSPSIGFYAFDIAIEDDQSHRYYLDYEEAIRCFEKAGLLYGRPLLIGSLNDALNYSPEFPSRVPSQLGLPPLTTRNIAEGIVIKPLKHSTILSPGEERPVLKIKNKEFQEDDRFHEAQKWSFKNEDEVLSIELILPELMKFANHNRLNAVISKIGRPRKEDAEQINEITALMIDDVLEGFESNYSSLLSDFSREEMERLREKLGLRVQQLLGEYFIS